MFVAPLALSGYFRRSARKVSEVIPRGREAKPSLLSPPLLAAPLYLSALAYVVDPNWMSWSSIPLPAWLRWAGATGGLGMVPFLYWVFRTLGSTIFESYPTRESHALVTNGPYRWVRHPLYAVATVGWVSLSILAANWFMLAMAFVRIIGISLLVIPREEADLIGRFGTKYREYMQRTGRLAPRLGLLD